MTDYVDHFRARVLQDAINEGLAATWERRAQAFEAALPRPGDFVGRATPEERRQRIERLTAAAQACRARAALSRAHDRIDADVWEAVA